MTDFWCAVGTPLPGCPDPRAQGWGTPGDGCPYMLYFVGNAVLGVPAAEGGDSVWLRQNLPIEVKFCRRNAGDGVPYGVIPQNA